MQVPIREAADVLAVSVDTVRRRLRAGELTGEFRGGKWYIDLPDGSAPRADATLELLRDQLRVKDEQIAHLLELLARR